MNNRLRHSNRAYTLIELSITLIIIGLIFMGIAAAKGLLKQAQLGALASDFQKYETAFNNFVNKYGQPPGDFNAASQVWPNCTANSASCNGNGNWLIDNSGEFLYAWRQLAVSDLLPIGICDPNSLGCLRSVNVGIPVVTLGSNIPSSSINTLGYMLIQGKDGNVITSLADNSTTLWNDGKTNALFVGKPSGASTFVDQGGLTAIEAFNLDHKIDDGKMGAIAIGAGTGKVRVFENPNAESQGSCLMAGNVSSASANFGYYNLSGSEDSCVLGLAVN